jgi:hypothetical protein
MVAGRCLWGVRHDQSLGGESPLWIRWQKPQVAAMSSHRPSHRHRHTRGRSRMMAVKGERSRALFAVAAVSADEAPLLGAVEQNLGDGKADHLGVGDLGLSPRSRSRPLGQEIVGQHVKCRQEGVEVGGHVTTSVWSALLGHADLRRLLLVCLRGRLLPAAIRNQ